jgi:pantoate--beta-alanine ligase
VSEEKADLVWAPSVEDMYPGGEPLVRVTPGPMGEVLDGASRPGHFSGMLTVVAKLLGAVRPDIAVFGEKDAQQLAVIRQMVRDFHLPVEIVPAPTIREEDGLAMSSRNAYLSPSERQAATVLYRSLSAAAELIDSGERRGDEVRRHLQEVLESEPAAKVEYAEVVNAETFAPVTTLQGNLVLPLAVRIGGTRLIDNIRLAVEIPAAGG